MWKELTASKTFGLLNKVIRFLKSIFFYILIPGLFFALFLSPPDYLQGDSVRIMYVHVPSAWISLASFSLIAALTILNFIFKIKYFKIICTSIAPIGLLFTALAIITGSIWGKPTWGIWWVWDIRITSMLVLMLFYIIYILNYKLIKSEKLQSRISVVTILLGLINLPIIKFSVDWWNTLHQPASIKLNATSTIHSSMLFPLGLMLLVFLVYAAIIFLMKYKTEIIKIKKNNIKRI
tara:strand:- start:1390 stop:2097 length:708 start_codon:yes stop_codon:yes gene_type:complete